MVFIDVMVLIKIFKFVGVVIFEEMVGKYCEVIFWVLG